MNPNPLSPLAVFVAWRDPTEHRCYPVGRLARLPADHPRIHDGGNTLFEFVYVHGAKMAKRKGFAPIMPFEQFQTVYKNSKPFPFFANRIMEESRPEYSAFIDRLQLGAGKPDPLELLARTGGIRATDSYEIFPLPRFDPKLPGFRTFFLVHALRYFAPQSLDRIEQLERGEQLYLMQDCQNSHDPRAMALRTDDRVLVGYIPNYLLLEVYKLQRRCEYLTFRVAKVSPSPAPLDQRLLCEIESCWPENYHPFIDRRFEPISELAISTADLSGGVEVAAP